MENSSHLVEQLSFECIFPNQSKTIHSVKGFFNHKSQHESEQNWARLEETYMWIEGNLNMEVKGTWLNHLFAL